ncbi:MAG: ribosome biogenesis GTP-binding protein YihA/YsxC [Bacteroidales bacterium]|nr:ribosome biogenesis GTP-binding protein YihA/YsxC [Bacteroidales bacterium]
MDIKYANYVKSSALISQCPEHGRPEYAFIGRSNVGKSSLINMLTGNKKLAKTSATPGKTLLINHFEIHAAPAHVAGQQQPKKGDSVWYLVDLPGYGFAKRSKTERAKLEQMISSYILQRQGLTNLFLLIDCRHEAQQIDLEFMQWLGESGVPFSIVFTKADKLSKQNLQKNIDAYLQRLAEDWEPLPPHFITSAETRLGRDELLDYIEDINKQVSP